MGRRLLQRWEQLAPRHQIMVATPVAFVVLFLFHQMFPLLSNGRRLEYALMECVPIALVITFATQTELARRRRAAELAAQRAEEPDAP